MVTLQDVARVSGYSVMTASRALSGRGYVSPRAAAAVKAAAARLNYVPNGVARSLRLSRTGIISLIISDIENAFYASIAKTAETLLSKAGFLLFVSSSEEDPEKERVLLTSVHEIRAEAVLITPTAHNGGVLVDLARDGLPIVQLDRSVDRTLCSSVLLDNEAAGFEAIEYLVNMGHRRIVFISGPRELTTGAERSRGAGRAADELTAGPALDIVEASSYLQFDATQSVRDALRLHPTAIVAGNNVVTEACMEVFAKRGIVVPSDISLLTFDDLPWMRWMPAPLTAIQQPLERMTTAAVELLLRPLKTEGAANPSHLRFPGHLMARESVARI